MSAALPISKTRPRGRLLAVALALGASLAGIGPASAGVGVWGLSHGSAGGSIVALAIDPQNSKTLYAATGASVFKTGDGGRNWKAVNAGLPRMSGVDELVIDPQRPAIVYAGTNYGLGIFKSTNGGKNWAAMNTGLPNGGEVSALAIDPRRPTTVYAGISPIGVFKSTDGGRRWRAVNAGLAIKEVTALAIDPQTPATVYASSYDAGRYKGDVFKSTDGGGRWRAVGSGLPADETVAALAIDPKKPATLYAGAERGVFKSTNGGRSWRWADAGMGLRIIDALAIDPRRSATLYAGTHLHGVYKSTDAGRRWRAANAGIRFRIIEALAIDPRRPATLYAGAESGVYKSTNGGRGWRAANAGMGRRSRAGARDRPAEAGATTLAQAASDPAARTTRAGVPAYHLVLTSDRDGDDDVYAVAARGGRLGALTRNRVDDSFAVVAPSGWFFVDRLFNGFIVSADGRRERNLGPTYPEAVLSPDGRLLALMRDEEARGGGHILVVPVAGGRIRDFGPGFPDAFSRDGRYLGFRSEAGVGFVDLRSGRRWALPEPYDYTNRIWSPRLVRVAYTAAGGSNENLVVVRARPRGPARTVARGNVNATWLDDRRLGLIRYDRNEIAVIDVEAGTERVIAKLVDDDGYLRYGLGYASWSPRGDAVAYLVDEGGTTAIVLARLGGSKRRLELGERSAGSLTWSPRGDRIAFNVDEQLHVLEVAPSLRLRRMAAGIRANYPVWSPDGRSLAVPQSSGVTIVPVADGGRPAVIPLGDLPGTLAWARGPLPPAAPTAAPIPQLDTRTKRLSRPLPPSGTLLSVAGSVSAFAQDGSRLAWVRYTPGPFSSVVEVLDVRTRTRTTIGGVRRDSGELNPGLHPWGFGFGDDRTLLIHKVGGVCGLSTCSFDVLTASLTDRRLRAVDGLEYDPTEDGGRVFAAGDGALLVYGGWFFYSLSGGRPVSIARVEVSAALAVAGSRVAIAERTDRPPPDSPPSPSPTSTISVRDAADGALVQQFDLAGAVYSLALSPSRVAALAENGQRTWIELREAQTGALIRSVPVPRRSSKVSIAGERVVFHSGRTIRLLDASTGQVSVLATAASTPIGLSIEGRRVAWAENVRGRGRIRAVSISR